jgi:hypothetical protein
MLASQNGIKIDRMKETREQQQRKSKYYGFASQSWHVNYVGLP